MTNSNVHNSNRKTTNVEQWDAQHINIFECCCLFLCFVGNDIIKRMLLVTRKSCLGYIPKLEDLWERPETPCRELDNDELALESDRYLLKDEDCEETSIKDCLLYDPNQSPERVHPLRKWGSIDRVAGLSEKGAVIGVKVKDRFSFVSNTEDSLAFPSLLINLDDDKCLRKFTLNKNLMKSVSMSHPHYNPFSSYTEGMCLLNRQKLCKQKHMFSPIPNYATTSLKEVQTRCGKVRRSRTINDAC